MRLFGEGLGFSHALRSAQWTARVATVAMLAWATTLSTWAGSPPLRFPEIPDPALTSGTMCAPSDPDFSAYRYREKIPYCKRNVSSAEKSRIYAEYGVSKECRGEYTIDHFIPLSLGGNNSPENLWPEHKAIKALRQDLEEELFKKISTGRITQAEAIETIRQAKWHPPVEQLVDFHPCVEKAFELPAQ